MTILLAVTSTDRSSQRSQSFIYRHYANILSSVWPAFLDVDYDVVINAGATYVRQETGTLTAGQHDERPRQSHQVVALTSMAADPQFSYHQASGHIISYIPGDDSERFQHEFVHM